MHMDRDPNRILGYIYILSKLRRLDRSPERLGLGARRNLLLLTGGQIKGLVSVDILIFSGDVNLPRNLRGALTPQILPSLW